MGKEAKNAKASKFQLPCDLSYDQAQIVMKAALDKAFEIDVPVNIGIVDGGCNLKAFFRMDGAFLGSIDLSIGKAETARRFNMSTLDFAAMAQPGQVLYGVEVTNGRLVIFGGGELLYDGNDVVIGAIGVSGGTVEEDIEIAKAGVDALKASFK